MNEEGYLSLLTNIIDKYVVGYFTNYSLDDQGFDSIRIDSPSLSRDLRDSLFEVDPLHSDLSYVAVDGSSRSVISSSGIISIASVAASSKTKPVIGVFPSFGSLKLPLRKPFLAVAPALNEKRNVLDPYLYSADHVMTFSLSGEPLTAIQGPEQIECELRTILETEAISTLRNNPLVIVDGPLFPHLKSLRSSSVERIMSLRAEAVSKDTVGVVKRISNSSLLKESLSGDDRTSFMSMFKIDPSRAISDEVILQNLVRFHLSPPYKPYAFGPIKVRTGNYSFYAYYLMVPLHRYLQKFSLLRVEMLRESEDLLRTLTAIPMSNDGIPQPIALADRIAKEITAGIYKLLVYKVQRLGLGVSFESRIEVV